MSNKILTVARNINKPLVKFLVVKGWKLRLNKKKRQGGNFRKLSKQEKSEIKDYWKKYGRNVSADWCSYLSYGNGIVDKRYIPESLYYGEILHKISYVPMGHGLSDKNLYSMLFNAKQPRTIIRKANNIFLNENYEYISLEDVINLCAKEKEIIIKPTNETYGGSGISFWSREDGTEKLKEILNNYQDVICQEIVEQHPFFDSIHSKSLNTLRLVTLMVDDEPVHLSTVLRMGRNNSKVDNFSAGGLICAVDKEGYLYEEAVQGDQRIIDRHPDGFIFKGKQVPFYDRIIESAKQMHYRIPYFKLVSWDYSLSPEGEPILIEGNYPWGQIDLHQLNIGPIFGEYTDRVLDYVYKGKAL